MAAPARTTSRGGSGSGSGGSGSGAGPSASRLHKELKDCDEAQWGRSGVFAVPVSADDITRLRGRMKGPEGTPYEGGVFDLEIELPAGAGGKRSHRARIRGRHHLVPSPPQATRTSRPRFAS